MVETVTQTFLTLISNNRETEAYRYLYGQYHSTLLRFATAYLKAREPSEEIVNDVIYKVWLRKENISEINNLRVYLFTAVRNSCLTSIAKTQKEHTAIAKLDFQDRNFDDPESLAISTQLHEHIKKAINDLPPKCRMIFEMIRMEGLRNKDVAVKLNISVNTIDVQLAIGMKRLTNALNSFNGITSTTRKN